MTFTWMGVHNDVVNIKDEVTYYLKVTTKLLEVSLTNTKMDDNAYMRNGTGYYRYHSLDDFLNGAAPEVVSLTYGYGGES